MQKIFTYVMLYSCLVLSSCGSDDAEVPPKSSFTVDLVTGKSDETEFTFTVDEVSAQAITLYPYGTEKAGWGTVLISKSSFLGGKAIVKYKYNQVGAFSAVVVTNNHSDNGSSVENSVSNAVSITITSDKHDLKKISLEFKADKIDLKSTNTSPDDLPGASNITVTVPYGSDKTKLIATFETSPFAVVKVGSVVQESGKTVNDFTSPVTYSVFSQDGSGLKSTYTVSAVVTPAETYQGIKSFSGKLISKAAKDKVISAYTDSLTNIVVLYDALGTPIDMFDSVRVNYGLTGKFAKMKYGSEVLKQDSLLKDINTNNSSQQVSVVAEDPITPGKVYTLYAVTAPKLELNFKELVPVVEGKTTDFKIELKVLKQTAISIKTFGTLTYPVGITLVGIKADGATFNPTTGLTVDFTKPVKFEVTVSDANIGKTYTVIYTATLVQL